MEVWVDGWTDGDWVNGQWGRGVGVGLITAGYRMLPQDAVGYLYTYV